MKATFNVLFYLRKNRPNGKGLVPVMGRITINGERAQFNTKVEIDPNNWDSKGGRGIGRSADIQKVNRILDAVKVKITDLYHKHLNEYGYVLPEKIKNIILGIDTDRKKMLLEYFAEYNDFYVLKVGKDTSQITANRYKLTRVH